MSKVKVVLDKQAVMRFLKSQEVSNCVLEEALRVARDAGEGFGTDTYTGRNRVNASVFAETGEAERKVFKENVLEKALYR